MRKIGIYVHIPFCKSKCAYCDFKSFANCEDKIEAYISRLKKEIENTNIENCVIDTIYIGGGTPSYIDSKYIVQILDTIKNKFEIEKEAEITIEINPGIVDIDKLEEYKNIGINRLSIGLQSASDRILKEIGRIHSFMDFTYTFYQARQAGFDNINVDLMLGLPTQRLEDLEDSVEEVIGLEPEHISIYSLILEEDTKLEKLVKNNEVELPSEELERKMYWNAKRKLEENGYIHYEISNFAKKCYESKHNVNCWNQKEYIGFGLAAHSYIDNKRFCNTSNLIDYINENNNVEILEEQTLEDVKKEYMLLGLRKIDGVDIQQFKNKFAENPIYLFRNELEKLVNEGLIEVDLNNIKLTRKGLDFANIVWEEFV